MPRIFGPNTSGGAYAEVDASIAGASSLITLSAWFRQANVTGAYWVFAVADKDSATTYYGILTRGDQGGDPVAAAYRNTTFRQATSTGPGGSGFAANTWHHVLGTFDLASPSVVCYLDGTPGTAETGANSDSSSAVDRSSIGRIGDSSPDNPFDGQIGRCAAWPAILTLEEIQALAAGADERGIRPDIGRYIRVTGENAPEPVFGAAQHASFTLFNSPARALTGPPVARRLIVPFVRVAAGGGGEPTAKGASDSGSGTDAVSVRKFISVADAGAGDDDVRAPAVSVSAADAGAGTDDVLGPAVAVSAVDAGSGLDAASVPAVFVRVAEIGAGADLEAILKAIPVSDSGAGADDASRQTAGEQKSASDSGSGSDAARVDLVRSLVSELGQGSDSAAVFVSVSVADTGAGADEVASSIFQALSAQDSGSGQDDVASPVLVHVQVPDSAQGLDAESIAKAISVSDGVTAVDAARRSALGSLPVVHQFVVHLETKRTLRVVVETVKVERIKL